MHVSRLMVSERLALLLLLCVPLACRASKHESASSSNRTPEAPAARSASPSATSKPSHPLSVGSVAPSVEAVDQWGKHVSLRELRGRPVVVYFYPKDNTKGCTIEAQMMRDHFKQITKLGATILGVSADDLASHREFAAEQQLPFSLLPDPDHRIAQAFGVPIHSGKAARMTFVIGAEGRVREIFPKVEPTESAAQVLAALGRLSPG